MERPEASKNTQGKDDSAKKTNRRFGWLSYLLLCICLWLFEEYIAFQLGFQLWDYLPKVFSSIATLLGILASGIFSFILDKRKVSFVRPKGVKFWTHARSLVERCFKRYIFHNTLVGIILLLFIATVVPAFAAKEQAFVKVKIFLTTPHHAEDNHPVLTTPDSIQTIPNPSGNDNGGSEKVDSGEDNEEDDEIDTSVPLAIRLILSSEVSPYSLSANEYNTIFFLDGDYAITNWELDEEVVSVVRGFVYDYHSLRLDPNNLEADTPQKTKEAIAFASNLESTISTSGNLEQVIDMRVEIYDEDPGHPLSKLIRENFCVYGDAYNLQKRSFSAAFDLYGHSVLWGFQTLRYDVSTESFYSDLKILEERYDKITQVAQADSFAHFCAGKLSNAFRQVAEELLEMAG